MLCHPEPPACSGPHEERKLVMGSRSAGGSKDLLLAQRRRARPWVPQVSLWTEVPRNPPLTLGVERQVFVVEVARPGKASSHPGLRLRRVAAIISLRSAPSRPEPQHGSSLSRVTPGKRAKLAIRPVRGPCTLCRSPHARSDSLERFAVRRPCPAQPSTPLSLGPCSREKRRKVRPSHA